MQIDNSRVDKQATIIGTKGINLSHLPHKTDTISGQVVDVKASEKQVIIHVKQLSPVKTMHDLVSHKECETTTTNSIFVSILYGLTQNIEV